MKKALTLSFLVIFALGFSATFSQTSPKILNKDLNLLAGSWKGSLTYLDYTSNKPYTMPADLNIRRQGNSGIFILSNLYPNEPKANSLDTMTISHNGKMINKEAVKSKRILSNGDIEIVTETKGIDGNENKPAIIRITYTIGKTNFTNIKEVQFVGNTQWIKRHEYSYTRK